MKFRFKADTIFEAHNLDDAFEKLAKHFMTMGDIVSIGLDGPVELDHIGDISLCRGDVA